MRNKLIATGLAALVLVVIVVFAARPVGMYVTKRHSPFEEVQLTQKGLEISVRYCRPYKKGREVFGALVPYGEVWRTGANEATIIDLKQDVFVGDQSLAAGRYALFTIPGPEEWIVIFNSVVDQWGAFDYDESQDVARATATVRSNDEETEQFAIDLRKSEDGAVLAFDWDMTTASLSITIPKDESPGDAASD